MVNYINIKILIGKYEKKIPWYDEMMLSKAASTIHNCARGPDSPNIARFSLLYRGLWGENRDCFNYSIHGKAIPAAGLICHSNNVQLKRKNASIILLLEYPCPKRHWKTCTSWLKVRVHQAWNEYSTHKIIHISPWLP